MALSIKIVKTDGDHKECLSIREKVFVIEQNISKELEMDDHLIDAVHVLAFVDQKPVGTARYKSTNFGVKLERFAVLKEHRSFGIGKELVDFILNHLSDQDLIYLHAQEQVITFYNKLGFDPVGKIFFEAEIAHQKMIYSG